MGLFDKGKESEDMKQTFDVKDATMDGSSAKENADNLPAPNEKAMSASSSTYDSNRDANPFNTPIARGYGGGSSLPSQSQSALLNEPSPNSMGLSNQDLASNTNAMSSSNDIGRASNPFDVDDSIPRPSSGPNYSSNNFDDGALFPMGANDSAFSTKDSIQEMVDETVEKVIEERWVKLVEKVEKVANWKEKQDAHINMIKEDIVTLKDAFEKLEKRIINKIGDYDKNILDVNSEIKALEKVFQKITPTLVNNVNELSKIANDLKTRKSDE